MLKNNYIINLKRRPDRWNKALETIKNSAMSQNNFIKFEAFDGNDFENEINRFNGNDIPFTKFLRKNKIITSKGYLGIHYSNLFLYKEIAENKDIKDDEYVGIYEDDFFIGDNFDNNYNKLLNIDLNKLNVDIMFLGGRFEKNWKPSDMNQFEKTDNENIYFRKTRLFEHYNFNWERTLHAYIVKKSICAELYNKLSLVSFYIKDNRIHLRAIDHSVILFDKWFKLYDWFPHLYYVPMNFDSNVQGNNLKNLIQF